MNRRSSVCFRCLRLLPLCDMTFFPHASFFFHFRSLPLFRFRCDFVCLAFLSVHALGGFVVTLSIQGFLVALSMRNLWLEPHGASHASLMCKWIVNARTNMQCRLLSTTLWDIFIPCTGKHNSSVKQHHNSMGPGVLDSTSAFRRNVCSVLSVGPRS